MATRGVVTPRSAPPTPAAPSPAASAPVEEESALYAEMQWVYGLAVVDLTDADGTVHTPAGERALFVYPMKRDADTGRVSMRQKRVHPRTAQLSMEWVVVHDPDGTPAHRVVDFALTR